MHTPNDRKPRTTPPVPLSQATYSKYLRHQLGTLGNAGVRYGRLLDHFGRDLKDGHHELLRDHAAALTREGLRMNAIALMAARIAPPAQFVEVHREWRAVADYAVESARLTAQAINGLDAKDATWRRVRVRLTLLGARLRRLAKRLAELEAAPSSNDAIPSETPAPVDLSGAPVVA